MIWIENYDEMISKHLNWKMNKIWNIHIAAERWRETAEGEWEVLDDYQFTPTWSHFTLNEYLRCPVWSCVVLCGPVWSCVVLCGL